MQALAVMAMSLAAMGGTEADAKAQLAQLMSALGQTGPRVLREAARSLAEPPEPGEESSNDLGRALPPRDLLGLSGADDEALSLRCRGWLEHLADDLDRAESPG